MARNLAVFTLALCCAAAVAAQEVTFTRLLLPVSIASEVPGAFGSRWKTEVAVTNRADVPVAIEGFAWACDPSLNGYVCPQPPTLPRTTFYPIVVETSTLIVAIPRVRDGQYLFVDSRHADLVDVHLRVQDVSRQSMTWGTEIPVVREDDYFTGQLVLQDVPIGPAFRQTFRVYDPDARPGAAVRVRFYAVDPTLRSAMNHTREDVLVGEQVVPLTVSESGTRYALGYAQLGAFAPLLSDSSATRVRMVVDPLTPGLRFWAFVSVTNNETQHVTVVTPQ